MKAVRIEVPEDLIELLGRSRLASRSLPDQVKAALTIHLFQEGVISIGKAAELAGEPQASLELLMAEMGIPAVQYDVADYRREWEAIQQARRKQP